ncbi:hypothetical protein ACHAXR_011851 [Thalassiosira sp. AJA248-18]
MSPLQRMVPLLTIIAFILLSKADAAKRSSSRGSLPKKAASQNLRASLSSSAAAKSLEDEPLLEIHYPDVTLKGCRSSTNEHLTSWLEQNVDNGYLFRDLTSCCNAHFIEDVDTCFEASKKINGMGGGRVESAKLADPTTTFNNDQSVGGGGVVVQQRRLGKSGKSSKSNKAGKKQGNWKPPPPPKYQKPNRPAHKQKPPMPAWQKPPPPQQNTKNKPKKPQYHNHGPHWHGTGGGKAGKSSKSSKSSKAKTSKAIYHPPPVKPRTKNPTRRPTPRPTLKPTTPKPVAVPIPTPDDKSVEISMGGMLAAHNLNIPPPGSQELTELADVFEKTILTVLDDEFECNVHSIGGFAVNSNDEEDEGAGMFDRNLQSSDVLFNLRTIQPCPDCSSTQAVLIASRVFDETFDELDEKAKSGELTVIFCIFAEVAGLVTEPCSVTITNVDGTSLDVSFVSSGPTPPSVTPRPTMLPIMPEDPTPNPTLKPVVVTTTMPTAVVTSDPIAPEPTTLDPTTLKPTVGELTPTPNPTDKPVILETMPPTTGDDPNIPPTDLTKSPTTSPIAQTATDPPSTIPDEICEPNAPCSEEGSRCTVGTETCCGETYDSLVCTCETNADGSLGYLCLNTDACMMPLCEMPTYAPTSAGTYPPTLEITMLDPTSGPTGTPLVPESKKPTLSPVAIVEPPPTGAPLPASKSPSPTPSSVTTPPVLIEQTKSPTVSPSIALTTIDPVSSLPTASPNVEPTTDSPTEMPTGVATTASPTEDQSSSVAPSVAATADGTTSSPTEGQSSSVAPSVAVTTDGTATSPSEDQLSSSAPSVAVTADGTTDPPTPQGSANVTASPTPASSPEVTGSVTSSPTPATTTRPPTSTTTIAPTSIPPGATFYDGFEKGALPFPGSDPEWTTEGDGLWEHTTERSNGGVYSIKSPVLSSDELTPLGSNLTLTMGEDFGAGTLVLSVLSGANMPYDDLLYYVDGQVRGHMGDMASFATLQIQLGPGAHTIKFSYQYNPVGLQAFPPENPERIGAVFIDDVYFLPAGITVAPTGPPVSVIVTPSPSGPPMTVPPGTPSPTVSVSPTLSEGEPTSSVAPTPVEAPTDQSSIAPTLIPPGAIYYDGFEEGTFPGDPEWSTAGDGLWELTTERSNSGVYSIKSPDLSNEAITSGTANVTIFTDPNWGAGTLVLSILAGVSMPYDDLLYYVDGTVRGQMTEKTDFETLQLQFGPGPHTITFSYNYNPVGLTVFPPEDPARIGAVFIDDVYFLPMGNTVAPTKVQTASPTLSAYPTLNQGGEPTSSEPPTPAQVPSTIAPTSLPPGAIYYDGFEQASFPEDPEWTTEGNGTWALSMERSTGGMYSIKSPNFMNLDDNVMPKNSNVTITTNPTWDAGSLVFSIMAGVNMPFDNLVYYVDGQQRGQGTEMTDFETRSIPLSPGQHIITFSYDWNPVGVEVFPPVPLDRIGAVFIDDVYFLPEGGIAPTDSPVSSPATTGPTLSVLPTLQREIIPTPPTTNPVAEDATAVPTALPTFQPTEVPTSMSSNAETEISTIAPTSIPSEAVFYDGFEQGTFPDDPEWSTEGDGVWELTTEKAHSGVYSIRSPDLTGLKSGSSSVTLSLGDPGFEGGSLVLSVMASLELPIDLLSYFVDGVQIGQMAPQPEFETLDLAIGPGPHEITFEYKHNPFELDALPPSSLDHTGVVFIDDVYVLPFSDTFFDGFETGDFTGLEWEITGEEVWMVDESNPFEGSYAAHVRVEDISTSGNYSQLNLDVTMGSAAFIQFYFFAPLEMPFESLNLSVDGQFLTGLQTVDETWTQAGAILSSGQHTISWRLTKNPGGAPEDLLMTIPQAPYRVGEAWLDNIELLPSTPSFVEFWESGDFSANAWILTGDADWAITDSIAYEGANSATIASDDIEASSGVGELSIDIITEQGGVLNFLIRPSVEGPFEIVNVLIDDIIVLTYSGAYPTTDGDWLAQEINIQPGKRMVTFQLLKNPTEDDADFISTLPSPPGREGQVWLDGIEFTATAPPS